MSNDATVRICYTDGTPDTISTYGAATRVIATRYGVDDGSLVTEDGDDRMLVWLDEESAENDDGSHAVAEVRGA